MGVREDWGWEHEKKWRKRKEMEKKKRKVNGQTSVSPWPSSSNVHALGFHTKVIMPFV